ncbi:ABC transporter substrate-binding protein [Sporosarcina sp. Te-1]|uniref:ABC transporter substrate-binding protein n=1 Tax=Sporosarcina sp. Te-1 TaxID=2818390 RepID=UPI001A9E3102|nr:helical backbone metal receptor [Sporosarcina sp. Te-1]QTD42853.1 ABC transporter substrate-binding protein [Sporosarcina sp. Te-1]
MKKEVIDRTGRYVSFSYPPKRVISLCPGITDTLFALGLEQEIVGRTRFCKYPEDQVQSVPAVAGTKDLKLDAILAAAPDLVILEKEENTKEMAELLEQHVPVYVAEVQTIHEAYQMIETMGDLTNRKHEAKKLMAEIRDRFDHLTNRAGARAAYVIWKKPYMVVGKDTYIQDVLQRLGFENPFRQKEGRYPTVTPEDFQQAGLETIFLASEPYPFKEKHLEEFKKMAPEAEIVLIDGEMFWYGPRMLDAPAYFNKKLGM